MKVSMNITPVSLSTFRQALMVSTQRVISASAASLENATEHAFVQAQARVPRITGALADSANITNHDSGTILRRTISYGSSNINPRSKKPTADYALQVHEIYNEESPNSYKWLELAMQAYGHESFITELASAIRSAL